MSSVERSSRVVGCALCEPIFEVTPEPLDGIELGGIGRQEHQGDIAWEVQCLGFVEGAIVEQQQMEASRIGGSKMIKEELKALGIEDRQFEKETLSR